MPEMVNPIAGTVETVSDAEVSRRKREGWTVATPEQARKAALEQKHGGITGQVVAGAAGALRTGTFGASDVILSEVGGEQTRRTLQELAEVNAEATMVGEVAGSVIGPGAAGAAKLGRLAARGVGGGVRGLAAAGAAEGLLYGGQSAISESVLQNKELTAEALLSSMGYGAAVGGAFGGAIAGTGRLVRAGRDRLAAAMVRPTAEGAESLARQAFGEAADGVGDAMSRAWRQSAETLGVAGADAIETLGGSPFNRAARSVRQEAVNAGRIIADEAERAVSGIKNLYKTLRQTGDEFTGALKRKQVARVIAKENAEAALMRSRAEVDAIAAEMDGMVKAGRGAYGKQGTIKKLRDQAKALRKQLDKTADPTDAMMALDDLKRDIGKMTVKQAGKKAHALQGPERATRQRFDDLYERMRSTLEDESIWGGAARLQKEVNAPWSRVFESQREGDIFREVLRTREGRFGERFVDIDEKKLRNLLKSPSDPIAQQTIQGMRQWLESGEEFVRAAGKNLDVADKRALAAYKGQLDEVRGALDKMTSAHSLGEQLNALSAGAAGGQTAATGLGYALGSLGPVGAPLAMLAGVVADPARGIRQLAAVESLASRIGGKLNKAGSRLPRVTGKLPRLAAHTALAERTRDRFERQAKAARDADPAEVEQSSRERFSGLAPGAPETVDAAVQAALRGAAYLREHAPRPRQRPDVLGPAIPPSDHELEIFERRRAVVQDPVREILEQVETGALTREAVHALDAVYPEMAEQMRQSYRDQLITMAEAGESLPQQTTLALEMLLGQPLEGINHPDTVRVLQEHYAATRQPEQQPGGPEPGHKPNLAEHYKDRLFDGDE